MTEITAARLCRWVRPGEDPHPLPAHKRRDAGYCGSTCRSEATRARQEGSAEAPKPLRSAAKGPTDLHSAEKKRWQAVAEEGIRDHFRQRPSEPFHSDYLDSLIPDEHRRVISNAVMRFVNKGWIEKDGERASKIPSRNASKSGLYRLTAAGVDEVRVSIPPPPRRVPVGVASSSPYSPDNPYA